MHDDTNHSVNCPTAPLALFSPVTQDSLFTTVSIPFLQRLLTNLHPALAITTSSSLHSLTTPKSLVFPRSTLVPKSPLPSSQTAFCTTAFPVLCTLSRTDPKVCSDYPQTSRAPIPTPALLHTLFAELKSPPFPPTADRRLVHLWLP